MTRERHRATALLTAACVLTAVGVVLGAFGAHGLRTRLSPDLLDVYHTAVQYHLVHGLAAAVAALAAVAGAGAGIRPQHATVAGWLFIAGTVVFSGTLYVLALTGVRSLGAITPIGGVAFIAGWLVLAWSSIRRP